MPYKVSGRTKFEKSDQALSTCFSGRDYGRVAERFRFMAVCWLPATSSCAISGNPGTAIAGSDVAIRGRRPKFLRRQATFAKFIDHGKKLHSMMHNEMQLALIGLLKRRCLIKEDNLIKKMIRCNGGLT